MIENDSKTPSSVHISLSTSRSRGRYCLEVRENVGETQFRPLFFDSVPRHVSGGLVLSAGLALIGYAPSQVTVDRKVSREYADELFDSLGTTVVDSCIGQDDKFGVRPTATVLKVSIDGTLSAATPGIDETRLYLLPSERFSGTLAGVKEVAVGSNAAWLSNLFGMGSVLSSALLFSADLMANTISLPTPSLDSNADFYRRLCEIHRIALEMATEEGLKQ